MSIDFFRQNLYQAKKFTCFSTQKKELTIAKENIVVKSRECQMTEKEFQFKVNYEFVEKEFCFFIKRKFSILWERGRKNSVAIVSSHIGWNISLSLSPLCVCVWIKSEIKPNSILKQWFSKYIKRMVRERERERQKQRQQTRKQYSRCERGGKHETKTHTHTHTHFWINWIKWESNKNMSVLLDVFLFYFFFLLCPFAFFKRARCFSPLKRFFFSTFASSTFETQLWNELIKADQNCFFFLHNEKRFHFAHFCYFALPLMHTISWRKKKYCEEKRTIHLIADCVKMENNLTPFESL